MLLAIDVGNTNTKFAVFDGDRLVADWRISTVTSRTEDEYAVVIGGLFERAGLDIRIIDGVAISSTVPGVILPLTKFSQCSAHVENPLVIGAGVDGGIDVRYNPRTDVAGDRIANAVAAHAKFGGPVIVVDFGTGTTFDAVAADGTYLGGAIAPGIEISIEALVARAAMLRRVQFVRPPSAIGTSTVESVQSGVVFGFAGQVDGIVGHFKAEMGEARVVATGGLAELIAEDSKTIEEVDQLLTLEGIRIIYERAQKG